MKAVLVIVCFALIFCSATVAINLQQALESNAEFSSFTQHLRKQNPDLWNLLGDNTTTNTYTVFATINGGVGVNNSAYEDLLYQVVSGSYDGTNFLALQTISTLYFPTTLNGSAQVIALSNLNSPTVWAINGQAVIKGPSVEARNGWVHGISELINPPKISLADIPQYNTTLYSIFRRLNIVNATLQDSTLLIPTEPNFVSLFEKYPYYRDYFFNTNTSKALENLQNIINAHVLPKQLLYPDSFAAYNFSGPYPTADSIEGLRFYRTGNLSTQAVEVIDARDNKFPITQANVLAPNGVAHYFDGLIIPQNFALTLEEVLNLAPTAEFFKVLEAAKLTDTFLGLTDSTFFIPIDANFTGATVDQLLLHVVPGINASFDGEYHNTLSSLRSLNNRTQVVYLSTENLYENETIVVATVKKINGIPVSNQNSYPAQGNNTVYFIPTVLELPGPPTNTFVNQGFSEFNHLLGFAGNNVPINTSEVTIFAPTNEAVNSLQPGVLGFLTLANSSEYTEMVEAIVANHIVANNILYRLPVAVNGTLLPTLNDGKPIILTNDANRNNSAVINGYSTVQSNSIPTANGIIYPIDSVIIPLGYEFNLSSILIGLGNERFNNSDDGYGSYNKFLDYLRVSGLLETLSAQDAEYTIFAPTDEAFDKAVDNFAVLLNNDTMKNITNDEIEKLTTALNYHVILNKDLGNIVPQANISSNYTVGDNDTVVVDLVGPPDNIHNYRVNLYTRGENGTTVDQGSGNLVLNTTTSYKQRIYGINRVLGLPVKAGPVHSSSGKHKGLTTAEWVLIGVGGAALGLILLLIVAGVVYYLLIRPKSGYRKIN